MSIQSTVHQLHSHGDEVPDPSTHKCCSWQGVHPGVAAQQGVLRVCHPAEEGVPLGPVDEAAEHVH